MTSTNVAMVPPPSDDEVAVCYLCLDGGADNAGQPLRRDCACRGTDAGFVHLSCLVGFAETKSMQAHNMDAFRDPWRVCPSCHQKYQNEFAVDIATKFVSFVRRQFPRDTQMQVEALHMKMAALDSILDRLQPVQKREAGVTADVILSLIDLMKGDASPLPRRYSQFQANACNALGHIALDGGTEESARRAVVHFQTSLKVYVAICDDEGAAFAKANIAYAKSMYEGGRNNDELMTIYQELYEICIAEFGDENELTIRVGKEYACCLQTANRGGEARVLLMKLLATSKQVFGSHHNTTKDIESTLQGNFDEVIAMSVQF